MPVATPQQDAASLPRGRQRRLLWAYGLGDAGTGMAATQMGFYLFVFFTAVVGLPAWMAGSVLMVLKIWDGINDPLVGYLSDHTRHRFGPRLPWLLWGAVPLGLCLVATWWVPPGGLWLRFAVLVLIASATQVTYTCVNLPYSTLAAELTSDVDLRTRLNAARFTGSIIAGFAGIVLAAVLGLQVRECGPSSVGAGAFQTMGLISGLTITVGTLACAWGLMPFRGYCQQPSAHPEPLLAQLRRIAANPRFLRVLGLYLLLWCALQLMQTVALLYLTDVIGTPAHWSTWILVPFQLSALLGLQLWSNLSARIGRLPTLRRGGLLWIGGCAVALLLPALQPTVAPFGSWGNGITFCLLLAAIVVVGLGAATAFLIPWSLLPDAIDADPDRPAGLYNAWMVIIQKFGIGLSVFVLGNILSLSGYRTCGSAGQPDSALGTIRLAMGLIPAVLVVLGLLLMRSWPRRPHLHPAP